MCESSLGLTLKWREYGKLRFALKSCVFLEWPKLVQTWQFDWVFDTVIYDYRKGGVIQVVGVPFPLKINQNSRRANLWPVNGRTWSYSVLIYLFLTFSFGEQWKVRLCQTAIFFQNLESAEYTNKKYEKPTLHSLIADHMRKMSFKLTLQRVRFEKHCFALVVLNILHCQRMSDSSLGMFYRDSSRAQRF